MLTKVRITLFTNHGYMSLDLITAMIFLKVPSVLGDINYRAQTAAT